MARHDKFFGGGHEHNDSDRDFDGKPGSSYESPQYARTYDARSQTEYTNRPETVAIIRQRAYEMQEDNASSANKARRSVQFFPDVGKFIIPKENTWAAHAELVKDPEQNLYFNPDKYVYFDKIIAEKFKNPALWDSNNPNYDRYEGLRTNIAVMRNDTIGLYLNDGEFNPGDEKFIPLISGIASELGDALANDKWYKRLFTKSLSVDVARVEGVGAREMYKYLLERETSPTSLRDIATSFGMKDRTWFLPPIEETPYGPVNLAAAPPRHDLCFTPDELAQINTIPGIQQQVDGVPDFGRVTDVSESLIALARNLTTPASLTQPDRKTAVEEARVLVRWLKNLQSSDKDMETWMSEGTIAEQASKAEAVSRLVGIYAGQLKQAAGRNPSIIKDFTVVDANEAGGALALGVSDHALSVLPDGHPGIARLEQSTQSVPDAWDYRQSQSVTRLLDTLTLGIERVSGTAVDERSYADRLTELSARINATAKQLRSVDTLEPPAREESIELAREILRRLKNMQFSDKTLEDMVTTGRPEDKAAFAQKLDDMVDAYKNLLSEAAQANPDIFQDERIKQANEAVGSFSHAVKLMAAKEMPGSVAAAQQISADAALDPEEWKNLQDRTVGRLVKSMEGGLEKAVGDLEVQQQQQQSQAEEQNREAAEAAAAASSNSRRKRRRRSGGQRSGSGGGKQRKENRDISADDFTQKQGVFRETKQTAPMPGVKAEDMAAIKALGGSLLNIGNQAKDMAGMTSVTATDKLKSDDKGFAKRKKDERDKSNAIKL